MSETHVHLPDAESAATAADAAVEQASIAADVETHRIDATSEIEAKRIEAEANARAAEADRETARLEHDAWRAATEARLTGIEGGHQSILETLNGLTGRIEASLTRATEQTAEQAAHNTPPKDDGAGRPAESGSDAPPKRSRWSNLDWL